MRKTVLLVSLTLAGIASIALSPRRAEALDETKCWCVGGCEGYVYLNPCENNQCSWSCNTSGS